MIFWGFNDHHGVSRWFISAAEAMREAQVAANDCSALGCPGEIEVFRLDIKPKTSAAFLLSLLNGEPEKWAQRCDEVAVVWPTDVEHMEFAMECRAGLHEDLCARLSAGAEDAT
jgi:hypothetical protein